MTPNEAPRASRSTRREVLWWSGVVVGSAALGLIFALVVLAVRSSPAPATTTPVAPASPAAPTSPESPATPPRPTVTVATVPSGALLFAPDGAELGRAPLTLPIEVGSKLVIVAKLDGFPPITNFAENVQAGDTITIQLANFFDGTPSPTPRPSRDRRSPDRDRDRDRGSGAGSASAPSGSGSAAPGKKKGSGDFNDIID